VPRLTTRHGNLSASIRVSFEPSSKENNDSFSHSVKACSPIVSTELGMQIDRRSRKAENAQTSIRVNCDSDSKGIIPKDAGSSSKRLMRLVSRGIIQYRGEELGRRARRGTENENDTTLHKTRPKHIEFRAKVLPRNSASEILDPVLGNM
jgi:hypothetical protein